MVRRVTPSQFRTMVRQAEQKQRQAIDRLNRDIRTHNQKVVQKVNQAISNYNREARAHNARVRSDRQRLKNEIAKLGRQTTTTRFVTFRTSVRAVQTSYERLDRASEQGTFDEGLADGKPVRCFARERDLYGRAIALCVVDGREINPLLVREGLAWAFTRYSDDYAGLEAQARAARVGIWQGKAEPPWEYRENRWARAAEASPRKDCPIKGNISGNGVKIYHTPWSPNYDRTGIDEARGERWFCDEAEALSAGWRASRSR